ncbi:MAG: amidohydrolase family protein [Acidobacteriota bacterium]
MRLRGARVATGPAGSARRDVGTGGPDLDLSGHLLLPGLINAHDHLELNLFPRLGSGWFHNAGDWAARVYRPDASPVREHRAIPKTVRLMWGGIRNLLSGVTTVVHHNPWDPVFDDRFPVHVVKRFGWAHSLEFSADIGERFADTPVAWPFVMHAAEGRDTKARAEIARLDELGILSGRTVLVHANAAGPRELECLRARGCSMVWCPSSNLANYGSTLGRAALQSGIPIALGTDSAITAGVDLLDEIRLAHRQFGVPMEELYRMVTSRAAAIFRLETRADDLVAVADTGQTPAEALLDFHPELVLVGGQIRLVSARFEDCVKGFHPIGLENRGEWRIDADIPSLTRDVRAKTGPELRLAGKLVTA